MIYLSCCCLIIAILWGIQPLIQKNLMNKISSESVLVYQVVFNFIFIIIYILFNQKILHNDFNNLTYSDLQTLFGITLICGFAANILYYYLLKNHDPSIVITLVYSAPLFTLIFSKFFYNKYINNCTQIGILLSILGLGLIGYANND
jgi:drug/metabolite transporter (DMT)-like permease